MHKYIPWMVVLLLSGASIVNTATAHAPSFRGWAIPEEQWTPETQLWLTKAVTAEVGWNRRWKHTSEQVLLAFILRTRYYLRKVNNPDETFIQTIRAYCRGLRTKRKFLSARMFWINDLRRPISHLGEDNKEVIDYPIERPEGFYGASWEKHQKYYGRAWVAMGRWAHGGYGHPCPKATHWGGRGIDPVPTGHKELKCSKRFRNAIYGRK